MISHWRVLILSAVMGAGSGIIATALTTGYLAQYAAELGEQTAPLRLSQVRPQALPASYEAALEQVHQKAVPAFASVLINTQAVGASVALTSDGWFAAVLPSSARARTPSLQMGEERYAVERIQTDPVTGVSFLKITAENLPVAAFGQAELLRIGAQVFVLPASDALLPTTVYAKSEIPPRVHLVHGIESAGVGAPVFNLASELVGLVNQSQGDRAVVVPTELFLPAFENLLKAGRD